MYKWKERLKIVVLFGCVDMEREESKNTVEQLDLSGVMSKGLN